LRNSDQELLKWVVLVPVCCFVLVCLVCSAFGFSVCSLITVPATAYTATSVMPHLLVKNTFDDVLHPYLIALGFTYF
jgi:hypothetical protein